MRGSAGIVLLTCLLLLVPRLTPARRVDAAGLVSQAEQAFDQGQYDEVLRLLSGVPEQHPLADQARFLRAYAHYHLGRLEQAATILDGLLEQGFVARVSLLRGMVAFALKQLPLAIKHLQAVIDSEEKPWADTAREVLPSVQEAQAALNRREHARALKSAKAHLRAGRHDQARADLDLAEAALPSQVETRYYRGYMAYKQKRYMRARRHFHEALALRPDDEWSRYMLSLCMLHTGEQPEAKRQLQRLVSTARKKQVRRVSSEALARLEQDSRPKQRSSPKILLEVGSGLDTNPGYINEVPAELGQSGLELHASALAGYQLRHPNGLTGGLGASIFERAYAMGGERFEQTEASAWASAGWSGSRFDLTLSYSFGLFLYGHDPLYTEHSGHVELGQGIGRWVRVIGAARVTWRDVHDQSYDYLPYLGCGGSLGVRITRAWLSISAGYEALRDWADPMQVDETVTEEVDTDKGRRGPPTTIQYTVSTITDYTLLGHGPFVWLNIRLPWRLKLIAGAGLQWRRFDNAGIEINTNTGTQTRFGPRRDLKISTEAELARSLAKGLQLALRFESVDNRSSMSRDEWGLDRTYSRRLAGLVLRWIWPDR